MAVVGPVGIAASLILSGLGFYVLTEKPKQESQPKKIPLPKLEQPSEDTEELINKLVEQEKGKKIGEEQKKVEVKKSGGNLEALPMLLTPETIKEIETDVRETRLNIEKSAMQTGGFGQTTSPFGMTQTSTSSVSDFDMNGGNRYNISEREIMNNISGIISKK